MEWWWWAINGHQHCRHYQNSKKDRQRKIFSDKFFSWLTWLEFSWNTQQYSRRYNKDVVNGSSCVYDKKSYSLFLLTGYFLTWLFTLNLPSGFWFFAFISFHLRASSITMWWDEGSMVWSNYNVCVWGWAIEGFLNGLCFKLYEEARSSIDLLITFTFIYFRLFKEKWIEALKNNGVIIAD